MDGWMEMRAIWKRRARYTHPPSSKMTQIGAIAAFGRRRETSPSILEGVSEQMRGLEEEEEEEEGAFRSPLEGGRLNGKKRGGTDAFRFQVRRETER